MKNILFLLSIVLLMTWVITFIFLGVTGMMIHTLPVMAMLFVMQAIIITPKPRAQQNS